MPPSRFSPDFRARTNITSSCCLALTGKPGRALKSRVAQPSEPVGCSLGAGNMPYGTAVAKIIAPWTEPPHALTWTRALSWRVPWVMVPGFTENWSMFIRAGGEIPLIAIVPPLADGQPFDDGAGGGGGGAV